MESPTRCGEAARTAGRMLELLNGAGGWALGDEWRRLAADVPGLAADGGEAERWELLAAIAEDAGRGPSRAAVELLRHLAAGPVPAAACAATLP